MARIPYLLIVVAWAFACEGSDSVVARLVEHSGGVDRDRGDEQWTPVKGKDSLLCEHAVRTHQGAWARLELSAGGSSRLEENTLVRLSCSGARQGFRVEFGESEIVTTSEGQELDIEVGQARVSRGRYRLRTEDGKTRFEVIVGSAVIRRPGQSDETLAPDQGLEIEVGSAVVRRFAVKSEPLVRDAGMAEPVDAATSAPAGTNVMAMLRGKKNQLRAPGAERWQSAPEGEQVLAPGTGLRVGKGGQAELTRGSERAEIDGPAEVVVGQPGQDLLEAKRGSAVIHATDTQVRIRVPGGVIIARRAPGAGSRARIDVDRNQTRIRPESGIVDITSERGETQAIQLGERAVLGRDGQVETQGRQPDYTDMSIAAGESATIHDPGPPTAVTIRFADLCNAPGQSGEGVVEIAEGSSFRGRVVMSKGTKQATVLLPVRTHHYRVRCLSNGTPEDKARATGRLRVIRDDGTRQLPAYAPENVVDADGRRYTVLYQNRLPEIVFRWPRITDGGPYTLHIEPERGKAKTLPADKPRHDMRSGALGEGTYRFFFERGGQRSKTSTLRIEFDNAAPSAYLRSPRVNQSWGETLEVAGAALEGWSVSVAGTAISTDGQGRFSTRVPRPGPERALTVRIAHGKRGVHYYLRRDRSARP